MRLPVLAALALMSATPVFAAEHATCPCTKKCMTACHKGHSEKCECKECDCAKSGKCSDGKCEKHAEKA